MKSIKGLAFEHNEDGDLVFQSPTCSLCSILSTTENILLAENLNNFALSYFNQIKFTIEAYTNVYKQIQTLNNFSDEDEIPNNSGLTFSSYEIETLKHQDNPLIALYGYIFFITAKTSIDILVCLVDLLINQKPREEESRLPDFNSFYCSIKNASKKQFNESGHISILKPAFDDFKSNLLTKHFLDIRNKLVHKGYLCKISFGFKKSDGYRIGIEQGLNVINPKKEVIDFEKIAKSFFEAIRKLDNDIFLLIKKNILEFKDASNKSSKIRFNGSFATYELG